MADERSRDERTARMSSLSRARYAALFGPTTGDRIRLADTDLLIEITEDLSGGPGLSGDEAVFGGGKVLRESMGQARTTRADGAPDTVITGAIIITSLPLARARKADAGAPMLKCASPPATAASDLAPPPVRTMSGSMPSASK